jgi:lysozyme
MSRRVNEAALALIQQWEGLRLVAYQCSAGVWTIGYGSTRGVQPGMRITHEEANKRLREDLANAEFVVSSAVQVALNDNQFGALVSFVFNVGGGAFRRSSLLKRLNAGEYEAVPGELLKWNKARVNGVLTPIAGLANRRAAECGLWVRGDFVASSSVGAAAASAPAPSADAVSLGGIAAAAAAAAPAIQSFGGVPWPVALIVVAGAVAAAAVFLLRRQRAA